MKLDDNMVELISHLEIIIGSHCYNPNSYNGWTGEEGQNFRYPVTVQLSETKERKYSWRVSSYLGTEEIRTMKYKFGSNHLQIGKALIDLLDFLENRYDLDFNELESNINVEN